MLARVTTLMFALLWASASESKKQILCNNGGLQYAVFKNTQGQYRAPFYSNYNPNYMKDRSVGGQGTTNLIYTSVTSSIGKIAGYCNTTFSVYGGPNYIPCEYHSMMYRGYIFAPFSGIYSILLSDIDDIAWVWLGENAKLGWNRPNSLMMATVNTRWPTQTGSISGSNASFVWMSQGQYYPIRILHVNGGGNMSAFVSIIDPHGNALLGANTGASESVVQYSCDGESAPAYPSDWGKEA